MGDERISISGLSLVEKYFLNILWEIQTTEELNIWKATLHPKSLAIVEKLQNLILMEYLDLELDKKDSFPYVEQLLEKYKK